MAELILFNKPYRVLSQFTDRQGRPTLADWIDAPGFYPAGRLDFDSEGLLLLCDNGALQQRISNPRHRHWKSYWLQLEGHIDDDAIETLRRGVGLRDGMTAPARVRPIAPPQLWQREPPVIARHRDGSSWIEIAIVEGRNRQLRRMAAAVGHPVLRLVRTAIGDWQLADLAPGAWERRRVHLPRAAVRRGRSDKIPRQ